MKSNKSEKVINIIIGVLTGWMLAELLFGDHKQDKNEKKKPIDENPVPNGVNRY